MEFMFNIGAGVGRKRQNRRHDVMLIQYLLNMATEKVSQGGGSSVSGPIRPPDLVGGLVQDGICGNDTQKFIDFYQKFRNANANFSDGNNMNIKFHVAEDGAIDPWTFPVGLNFQNAATNSPLSRTDTLVTLSYDAAKSREISGGFFTTMHPELKRLLCAH
jgi:hypothetical protein